MTQILRSRSKILEAFDSSATNYQRSILAMYNSRIQGIILDSSLMSLSIDDHMVHRGHSVFDTLKVINGKAYNLDRHLQRIINSANLAKIDLPMPIESMKGVLLDLAACTAKQNLGIRY